MAVMLTADQPPGEINLLQGMPPQVQKYRICSLLWPRNEWLLTAPHWRLHDGFQLHGQRLKHSWMKSTLFILFCTVKNRGSIVAELRFRKARHRDRYTLRAAVVNR